MTEHRNVAMSNHGPTNDSAAAGPEPETVPRESKKKKAKGGKKDRIRAAWIGFASRILAQFIGAAASVALGLLVVHSYTSTRSQASAKAADAGAALVAPVAPQAAAAVLNGQMSLAVLPLQDFSSERVTTALADALTEELIADLAGLEGVRVISRTSSMHYKKTDRPLREIAGELGASVIVEGSIVQAGRAVRVTAQLIDVGTDTHLWARSYDRMLGDPLRLQAEVAAAIAHDVSSALGAMRGKTPAVPHVSEAVAPTNDLKISNPEADLR
jgi:TolB-like protein